MADKLNNRCDKVFESASKSTLLTAGPTVCLIILAIVIIILSATQTSPLVDTSDDAIEKSWDDLCGSEAMGYLSPWTFEASTGGGIYGCPWRPRNTIFRLVIVCIIIITSGFSLFVLFSGKFETLWSVIYWANWIMFVMMFVAFVLDCDAINTGVALCQNDFTIDDTPIVGLSFPSGPEIPPEVEKCKLDPYIWTAIADLFASVMAFCAYKISKYYIFDPTERKASIGAFGGKIQKGKKKKTSSADKGGNSGQTTTATAIGDSGNGNANRKESDPFAEYQGGYEVSPDNRKETVGSAYGGSAYGDGMSAYDE